MDDVVKEFTAREKEIIAWLEKEYMAIQSGRVTPAIVERVQVPAYGATTALTHCAAIAVESAVTLTITPYDATLVPAIEQAIRQQVPSVGVAAADVSLRVTVPEVSGEQRAVLKNVVGEHAEEARQSVRSVREKVLTHLKKEGLSEEETYRIKGRVQELVDQANTTIDTMREKKVHDIQ